MKTLLKIALVVSFLTSSYTGISQGKIDRSKEELKSSSKRERSSGSYSSSSGLEGAFMEDMVKVFLYVTYYSVIGDYGSEAHLNCNLTEYPYYNHASGNYENKDAAINTNKRGRIDLENLFLFSQNDFFGNHFKAKLRPFQYFYFQTDYFQLMEYSKMEKIDSKLSIFNLNLCYDRIRFERLNLGWSLGLNYIANDVQKVGFSYGLNTEIFFSRTISLNSSMKWSSINQLPVNEFEVHLKHHIKKFYLSLGFEQLKIATPTYNFASAGLGIYL